MKGAENTRSMRAELDWGRNPGAILWIGNRPVSQYWARLAPYFRDVLLPSQRRSDDEIVSWSWRNDGQKRTPAGAELAVLRKRLASAQRAFVDSTEDDVGGLAASGPLAAGMEGWVSGFLAKSDADLVSFVACTDAGLRLHSWGLTTAVVPFHPDARKVATDAAEIASDDAEIAAETQPGRPARRRRRILGWIFSAAALAVVVWVGWQAVSRSRSGTGDQGFSLRSLWAWFDGSSNNRPRERSHAHGVAGGTVAAPAIGGPVATGPVTSGQREASARTTVSSRRQPAVRGAANEEDVMSASEVSAGAPGGPVVSPSGAAAAAAAASGAAAESPASETGGKEAPSGSDAGATASGGGAGTGATSAMAEAAVPPEAGKPKARRVLAPVAASAAIPDQMPAKPAPASNPTAPKRKSNDKPEPAEAASLDQDKAESPAMTSTKDEKDEAASPDVASVAEEDSPANAEPNRPRKKRNPTRATASDEADDESPDRASNPEAKVSPVVSEVMLLSPSSVAWERVVQVNAGEWQVRLLGDTILPTAPMRAGAEITLDSVRAQMLAERRVQLPAAFTPVRGRRGLLVESDAGRLRWQAKVGMSQVTMSANDWQAEISWPEGNPPAGVYEAVDERGRGVARLEVADDRSLTVYLTEGTRGWLACAIAGDVAAFNGRRFAGPGMPVGWRWSADARGARVDIPLSVPADAAVVEAIALFDAASGWAAVSDIRLVVRSAQVPK